METFAEVRQHIIENHKLFLDEPFQLGFEYAIDGSDRQEMADSIEAYRREEVPLVVPMKLMRHYFRRNPDHYIDRQWYLDPYPETLGLRNTI